MKMMKRLLVLNFLMMVASSVAMVPRPDALAGPLKWDIGKFGLCFGGNSHDRQLRSDNLNHYLIEMAKCVASSGRPRFGKRAEIEMDTPNASPYQQVGPKDTQWLKYYLSLPSTIMERRLVDELNSGQDEEFKINP